jgi:thiol-disulfide isomerase/thioredoxin
MKIMKSKILVLLSFALLFADWGCSSKEQQSNAGQVKNNPETLRYKGVVSEIDGVEQRADKAPNFVWRDASGKRISFDEFHDKVTVVNFWATWCGPCRREIPDLDEIHREYSDKGVKVIGVSVDRGPGIFDDVANFAVKFKMNYPVVIDNGDLEQIYGNIRAIPTTFILNKDGKIVERLIGMRSKEVFLASILPHTK